MKEILKSISRNVIRLKGRLTYNQLAEKANISVNTLYKVVYIQKEDIQLSTLIALSKALNVTIDKLIGK